MVQITEHTRNVLLEVAKKKKIYVEGNFLKLLKGPPGDKEFEKYLQVCKEKDTTTRKKRLEVTRQVQKQNKELLEAQETNNKLMEELKVALADAEKSTEDALNDLEVLQKKTQFELIGTIVKVALWVIIGIGLITSIMYSYALSIDKDTQIIGSAWSNLFGILLTNAFSIVGTIMGVKYATDNTNT